MRHATSLTRTLPLLALAVLAGCASRSDEARLITSADAAVDQGQYAEAIGSLSEALLANPDSPALRASYARAFATRAGATPARLATIFERKDEAGVAIRQTDLLSVMAGVRTALNFHDPAAFQLKLADCRKALSVLIPPGTAASALPGEIQAQVGALAATAAAGYLVTLFDGATPEDLTDEEIAAAVEAGYWRVGPELAETYAVAMETRGPLVRAVVEDALVAEAVLAGLALEAPTGLSSATEVTAALQRLNDIPRDQISAVP
jgi:hypothetical protein